MFAKQLPGRRLRSAGSIASDITIGVDSVKRGCRVARSSQRAMWRAAVATARGGEADLAARTSVGVLGHANNVVAVVAAAAAAAVAAICCCTVT